jgi:hypothetical protein
MRRPDEYDRLSDQALDILFGQAVGGYICDLKSMVNLPLECSLYANLSHFAPDDFNRPKPIEAGGEDFDRALDAAIRKFGGLQIDIVLTGPSSCHVYVTRPNEYAHLDTTQGEDTMRQISDAWIHASERDRFVCVRRSVIKCILALAEAPLDYTLQQTGSP